MNLNIDAFLAGVAERLEFAKTANLFEAEHTTFFPMIQSQASWHYSRHEGKLHLHDGHNTYSFSFPDELKDEDHPSERLPDSNKFEYNQNVKEKGTAQVHRADPGSIYLTLQDGRNNPTFTLQHQTGETWKILPKKRLKKLLPEEGTVTPVDEKKLLEGATKEAADYFYFHVVRP